MSTSAKEGNVVTVSRSKRTTKLIIGTVMAGVALSLATSLPASAANDSNITGTGKSTGDAYNDADKKCKADQGNGGPEVERHKNDDGSWTITILCKKS